MAVLVKKRAGLQQGGCELLLAAEQAQPMGFKPCQAHACSWHLKSLQASVDSSTAVMSDKNTLRYSNTSARISARCGVVDFAQGIQ